MIYLLGNEQYLMSQDPPIIRTIFVCTTDCFLHPSTNSNTQVGHRCVKCSIGSDSLSMHILCVPIKKGMAHD